MTAERIFLAGAATGAALALIFGRQPSEKAHRRLNQVAVATKRVRRGLRNLADKAKQQQRRGEAFAARTEI